MSYYLDSFHKHPQPKRKKKTTFPSLYWLYVEAFQQLASSVLSFTACAMQVWKFSQRWKFKVFLGLFWEWVQLWASTWPQLPSISRTFKKSYSKKKKKKSPTLHVSGFSTAFSPSFTMFLLFILLTLDPVCYSQYSSQTLAGKLFHPQKSSWLSESRHTSPSGSCKTGWNTS